MPGDLFVGDASVAPASDKWQKFNDALVTATEKVTAAIEGQPTTKSVDDKFKEPLSEALVALTSLDKQLEQMAAISRDKENMALAVAQVKALRQMFCDALGLGNEAHLDLTAARTLFSNLKNEDAKKAALNAGQKMGVDPDEPSTPRLGS